MCEDGSKKQQLTSNNTVDMYPAWSPDGKRIAYLSYRSEASDIWVIYSDGTGKINLTDDEASEGTPVWSPDGSRLVFESDRSGNWDIWVISSTGYYISQLTTDPAVDRHPSWSPNGKKIVFDSNRTGNFDLWIMDPDGSNQTRLTTNSQDDIKPQVSPDGRWILYMSKRPTRYYLPRDGSWIYVDAFRRFGDWFLWKSTLDGKHHIELMFFLEEYSNPIWSSDGSQVVFAMHGYNWHGTFTVEALQEIDIFSTDPYRLELKQVVALAGDDLYPCLSPDGKKVLFASQESGNFDIWMISTSEVSEPPTY